jgi:hypothetical protein
MAFGLHGHGELLMGIVVEIRILLSQKAFICRAGLTNAFLVINV